MITLALPLSVLSSLSLSYSLAHARAHTHKLLSETEEGGGSSAGPLDPLTPPFPFPPFSTPLRPRSLGNTPPPLRAPPSQPARPFSQTVFIIIYCQPDFLRRRCITSAASRRRRGPAPRWRAVPRPTLLPIRRPPRRPRARTSCAQASPLTPAGSRRQSRMVAMSRQAL